MQLHSSQVAILLGINDAYSLLVPDFFFPEIGNILWKRVRRGEASLENAQEGLGRLVGVSLHIHPSLPLTATFFRLICSHRLTDQKQSKLRDHRTSLSQCGYRRYSY
jgi:predicted nucleic acid-binding protein